MGRGMGGSIITIPSANTPNGSKNAKIINCTFTIADDIKGQKPHRYAGGLAIGRSPGTIVENCVFKDLISGLRIRYESKVAIKNNIFLNCGLYIDHTDPEIYPLDIQIRDNRFMRGGIGLVYLFRAEQKDEEMIIEHNTFHSGGIGLDAVGSGTVVIKNNIIANNKIGIKDSKSSGAYKVSNNNFWQNEQDYSFDKSLLGAGNLNKDPEFVSIEYGEEGFLRLKDTSPCKGKADDKTDLGARIIIEK